MILTLNTVSNAETIKDRIKIINLITTYTTALEKKDFDTLKEITTADMYIRTQEYFERIKNILFYDKLFLEEYKTDNNLIKCTISVGYVEYPNVAFFSMSSEYNRPVKITFTIEDGNYYISYTNIYDNKDIIPLPIVLAVVIVFLIIYTIRLIKRIDKTGKIF